MQSRRARPFGGGKTVWTTDVERFVLTPTGTGVGDKWVLSVCSARAAHKRYRNVHGHAVINEIHVPHVHRKHLFRWVSEQNAQRQLSRPFFPPERSANAYYMRVIMDVQ